MCMYMCPCLCSYVCTNVCKCVYTCINVNMSVESMNNFRSCTSGATRLVFWSRVAAGLRITTLAGLVGQGVLGICVSLSLPPQDWDCKCASPGLAHACLGSGDPAQVFAFVWQALRGSLFVLCGFCFAFVLGVGWLVLLSLLVRPFLGLQVCSTPPSFSSGNKASLMPPGSGMEWVRRSLSSVPLYLEWPTSDSHRGSILAFVLVLLSGCFPGHSVLICHFFRVRLCLWVSWLVLDWLF